MGPVRTRASARHRKIFSELCDDFEVDTARAKKRRMNSDEDNRSSPQDRIQAPHRVSNGHVPRDGAQGNTRAILSRSSSEDAGPQLTSHDWEGVADGHGNLVSDLDDEMALSQPLPDYSDSPRHVHKEVDLTVNTPGQRSRSTGLQLQ